MSIILAIEPDRRRAAQLTGMARAHLRAELLVAATASQAVGALDGRVPDVLLTAPLLPSHEEAAIADYLRQLGPSAAHVQTLTIPLLAGPSGEQERSVLSSFRRRRAPRAEAAEGCDPAVFAEQITDYLREARERRLPSPTSAAPPALPEIAALPAAVVPVPVWVEPPADILPDETFKEDQTFEGDEVEAEARQGGGMQDAAAPTFVDSDQVTETLSVQVSEPQSVVAELVPESSERPRARPVEDEWALFDPQQYGFPALIAKLDEIVAREIGN